MLPTSSRVRVIPSRYRSELDEAAFNHGYRRAAGEADGWLYFTSDINVPGEIALAVAETGAAWFLAVSHAGVAAELLATVTEPVPPGMRAAYCFSSDSEMRAALHRVYALACSLPTMPLYDFYGQVSGIGDTEKERLTKQRIGQDIFRSALDRYWNGCCPLTGIVDREMLRASHIVPWADCTTDAERLDVHNGLLLSVHWDAAFDSGLVSFSDEGNPLLRGDLHDATVAVLAPLTVPMIPLTGEHRNYIRHHRQRHGF